MVRNLLFFNGPFHFLMVPTIVSILFYIFLAL